MRDLGLSGFHGHVCSPVLVGGLLDSQKYVKAFESSLVIQFFSFSFTFFGQLVVYPALSLPKVAVILNNCHPLFLTNIPGETPFSVNELWFGSSPDKPNLVR